jgi:hypothetical protein
VKSAHVVPAIEPFMRAVNPWRLLLLFFVSGVAVRYASDRMGAGRFAGSRLLRIGVPIAFGVLIVVPPQTYLELRQDGLIGADPLAFYRDYLRLDQVFPVVTPTWNHLWYLVYLLVYVVLAMPIAGALRWAAEWGPIRWLLGGPGRLLLFVPAPLVLEAVFLAPAFPETHALWGDWSVHASAAYGFLLGYLAARNEGFWSAVDAALPMAAVGALLLLPTRLMLDATSGLSVGAFGPDVGEAVLRAARALYAWAAIVALAGLARRFVGGPSPLLRYLTGAVFCYYVVHQTVIVVGGAWLTSLRLPVLVEAAWLIAITVAACTLSYEAFRRVPFLALTLGIDRRKGASVRGPLAALRARPILVSRRAHRPTEAP